MKLLQKDELSLIIGNAMIEYKVSCESPRVDKTRVQIFKELRAKYTKEVLAFMKRK